MHWSGEPIWPPGDAETAGEREKLKVLEYLPAGTVHRVVPAVGSILCIGAGGGLDLLTAKYFGAKKITGVEINKGVVYATKYAFPWFAGSLYDPERNPDVAVHVAEGRHFLERSTDRYDVIQLSGVDTFSTTEAGAFSLSENYLYTVEAFGTYLRHLNPGGVLTLTRWFYPHIENGALEPRFELRLLALARAGLERAGVTDLRRSVFFLKSANFTVILVRPEGFTDEHLATLHGHCEHYGYDLLWSPERDVPTVPVAGTSYHNIYQDFMRAPNAEAFLARQSFDVTPPVDDRPFFFEVSRFDRLLSPQHLTNPLGGLTAHGILMVILAEVLLLGLVFVVLPLLRLRERPFPHGGRVRAGLLLYFTAIGFGFIVVEIVLSQKFVLFLGHPIYALAVILFSMLLFSGIGSLLSFKFPLPRFATLLAGGLALLPVHFFPQIFERFIGEELPLRIAISVGVLAPLGLVMGIPFPTGIRLLGRVRPGLIPWAWGINGYTSVLGSVLAVMLGIELGFTVVLYIAAGTYALGVIGYSLMAVRTDTVTGGALRRTEARAPLPEPEPAGRG
jgi:hypothetical protein